MNNLDAQYKLKKQYWYFGVLPLVIVYIIGVFLAGYSFGIYVEDCFIVQSCSKEMSKRSYFSATILKIIMVFLTFYSFWNVYRVFKISKNGIAKAQKIKVRIYVILFPVIAIIASPFLALFTNYHLNSSSYYDFIDFVIHKIPTSPIP